jgi:CRISPR system Cascade subunit CasE
MFLSRFEFNTARRAARDLLSSPQRLHAAVLAAFPAGQNDGSDDGRVLWRLDQNRHGTLLYLVSPHRPDLTHLVESSGWPTTQGWDTRDYTPLLDRLTTGDRWAFRLAANPVITRRKDDTATRSQRFGHVTVAQQTAWLLNRVDKHGFTVVEGERKEPDVAVRGRRTLQFTRQHRTVTIATAVFEGTLEITDPAALRRALTHGIGPAKGYGCGLLTLARAA